MASILPAWSLRRRKASGAGVLIALVTLGALSCPIAAARAETPNIRTSADNRVPRCVTPARLMAFLKERNHNLDPRFATIADYYKRHGEAWRVRWDYAFFQMAVETNFLTYRQGNGRWGDVNPKQNNFAGLGTTGGGVPGDSYPDVGTGVLAQIQHLVVYSGERIASPVGARTRLKQDDIIESIAASKGRMTFSDLSRRWAADRHYGASIEWVAGSYRSSYCSRPEPEPEPRLVVKPVLRSSGLAKRQHVANAELPPAAALGGPSVTPAATERRPARTNATLANAAPANATPGMPASRMPVRTVWSRAMQPESGQPESTQSLPQGGAAEPAETKRQTLAGPQPGTGAASKAARAVPPVDVKPVAVTAVDARTGGAEAKAAAVPAGTAPTKQSAEPPAEPGVAAPRLAEQSGSQSTAPDSAPAREPASTAVQPSSDSTPPGSAAPAPPPASAPTTTPPPARTPTQLAQAPGASPVPSPGPTFGYAAAMDFKALTATPSPQPVAVAKTCRVLSASYGGRKTFLVLARKGAERHYTALTVLDGFERSMLDNFLKVHAPGGSSVGEFETKEAALARAKEMCRGTASITNAG